MIKNKILLIFLFILIIPSIIIPKNADDIFQKGAAAYLNGNMEEAYKYLKQANKMSPDRTDIKELFNEVSKSLGKTTKKKKSNNDIVTINKNIKKNEKKAEEFFNKSAELYLSGDMEKAYENIKKAYIYDSTRSDIKDLLVQISSEISEDKRKNIDSKLYIKDQKTKLTIFKRSISDKDKIAVFKKKNISIAYHREILKSIFNATEIQQKKQKKVIYILLVISFFSIILNLVFILYNIIIIKKHTPLSDFIKNKKFLIIFVLFFIFSEFLYAENNPKGSKLSLVDPIKVKDEFKSIFKKISTKYKNFDKYYNERIKNVLISFTKHSLNKEIELNTEKNNIIKKFSKSYNHKLKMLLKNYSKEEDFFKIYEYSINSPFYRLHKNKEIQEEKYNALVKSYKKELKKNALDTKEELNNIINEKYNTQYMINKNFINALNQTYNNYYNLRKEYFNKKLKTKFTGRLKKKFLFAVGLILLLFFIIYKIISNKRRKDNIKQKTIKIDSVLSVIIVGLTFFLFTSFKSLDSEITKTFNNIFSIYKIKIKQDLNLINNFKKNLLLLIENTDYNIHEKYNNFKKIEAIFPEKSEYIKEIKTKSLKEINQILNSERKKVRSQIVNYKKDIYLLLSIRKKKTKKDMMKILLPYLSEPGESKLYIIGKTYIILFIIFIILISLITLIIFHYHKREKISIPGELVE